MGTLVYNWQARMRTAGALMDLQATPVTGYINVLVNKTRQNEISTSDRGYLLNWPDNTVVRVRVEDASNFYLVNKLELETSTQRKTSSIYGPVAIDFFDNSGIYPAYGFYNSEVYSGGDDLNYKSATHYVNTYAPTDLNGDGIIDDAWQVDTYTTSIDGSGQYTSTLSTASSQAAPVTTGSACLYNGIAIDPAGFFSEPNNSVYASFSDVIYAKEHIDNYGTNSGSPDTLNLCMRSSADPAHGLSELISRSSTTGSILTYASSGFAYIFSSREPSTDIAAEDNQKTDTTCRWYYTPDPNNCDDCWYAGKVVTVELTYKKAAISRTVSVTTYGQGTITYNLGSWSTHSTVTQTLTIPSGLTRQAINAAFDIPTQDGYVVALDDIKLVSVA